ncbi:NAD-dependent epimerase/dehydratase family protein [Shimia ponticola]|uniref:NAD-dependent epimerase/dehydratase family protein n=1 Tax=Shimia ponticola TaxID=2582893 RepID=UPI0011BEACE0|nr:NAD(P)-dependent oxidoreductase [Shimia ponticola]
MILVTGSSGHLGEALMRLLGRRGVRAVGMDIKPGPFTHVVGSIAHPDLVADVMAQGVTEVLHTATLHKPHVATHSRAAFVETNVQGTLTLLEAARDVGVRRFVMTSTTSAFGAALVGRKGQAVWIDETVQSVPKNIYGVTKTAAEDLCELFHRRDGMEIVILRTSRFFPEEDDSAAARAEWDDWNLKVNEFLHRRVDLLDAATAHLAALNADVGFGRYVISAPTPFKPTDLDALATDAAALLRVRFPDAEALFAARDWRLPPMLGRVYDSRLAQKELGWRPRITFAHLLLQMREGVALGSKLAREVGTKGYHDRIFERGPYPVEHG